jgi:hypothetical protein
MRPLKSLTLQAMIGRLSETFKRIPDERAKDRVNYPLHDTLMSGLALMFYQHPSLLQFQRVMKQKRGRCNLETIFGVNEVPSDTQMREILDGVATEPLRHLLPEMFESVRRAGWAGQFKITVPSGAQRGDYYTLALDGSDYFHSTKIACPGCLTATDGNGVVHYRHTVVAATVVRAGSHRVLPIDVEEVRNSDGSEKQDCEINAGKRLIKRFRQEHRQMKLIVSADDLYAHEPFVQQLNEDRLPFVLVAKPESHRELFQWVEMLETRGASEHGDWHEGPACRRRFFEYRIVRQVPLTAQCTTWVTVVEVWERNKAGRLVYHNSWVTGLEVDRENVSVVVAIGRSKWKIENEQFNVHKNHGYELEHNYGHGQQTLSMIFYLLNLLAFVAHAIVEMGDRLYQQCRAQESRRELWNGLRTLMNRVLVQSWADLLLFYLADDVPSP